jgi:hypothetical protein
MSDNLDLLAGIIGGKLLGGGIIDSLCLPSAEFLCPSTVGCYDYFTCNESSYICRAAQEFVCGPSIFTCDNRAHFTCWTYDCPLFKCSDGTIYNC